MSELSKMQLFRKIRDTKDGILYKHAKETCFVYRESIVVPFVSFSTQNSGKEINAHFISKNECTQSLLYNSIKNLNFHQELNTEFMYCQISEANLSEISHFLYRLPLLRNQT